MNNMNEVASVSAEAVKMDVNFPLVSIGMPVYNRPDLMRHALDSLLNQTYQNIEIIISDNASTDKEVKKIIEEYSAIDSRIRYFQQEKNIGPSQNFFFVLKQSSAEYFMWAADDDWREKWVIERCINALQQNPKYVAAMTETQYVADIEKRYPFFKEGIAFYPRSKVQSLEQRLMQMVKHNYGDLVYAVFRRDALMKGGAVFWELTPYQSLNEIAPLMYAAAKGEFLVFPEIGLYKRAPFNTYQQARWEMLGGRIPKDCKVRGLSGIVNTCRYHMLVMREARHWVKKLPVDSVLQKKLTTRLGRSLFWHCIYMIVGHKPKQKQVSHGSD